MNYKKGDIVIVKFPFILNQRTEKQKGRPALVISNERVERRYKDLLLASITSNIPMDIRELEMILEPVISTGLVKRSLLRLDFIIPYRVQYPAACCEVFVSWMGIPRSLLRGSSL